MAVLDGRPSFKGKAHPKKEIRHAIDNRIWHILRHDSHRGWPPVHARGKCAATSSLRAIVDNAQSEDDAREYSRQKARRGGRRRQEGVRRQGHLRPETGPSACPGKGTSCC